MSTITAWPTVCHSTTPDSGFDKSHPWKDRDPRFYHDIRFDGCKLELGGDAAADPIRYAPLYTDGVMRDVIKGSRTGYLNYKFIRDDFNQWDNQEPATGEPTTTCSCPTCAWPTST